MVSSTRGQQEFSLWSKAIGPIEYAEIAYPLSGKADIGPVKITPSDVDGMDVVIPAMNNGETLPDILNELSAHRKIHYIFVVVDAHSHDDTTYIVDSYAHMPFSKVRGFYSEIHGKGQNVLAMMNLVHTPRVIFCDADYINLTQAHITELTMYDNGMVIGIPKLPMRATDINIPLHVFTAWPLVSGFRVCPRAMVPNNLHGYLMEVQLNHAAHVTGTRIYGVYFQDLVSPFQWPLTGQRESARLEDRKWARQNLAWFKE